ncbi:MAG: hypothetical protein AAF587_07265 [Bacteroidota bacterium]
MRGKQIQKFTADDLVGFRIRDTRYISDNFTITQPNGGTVSTKGFAKVSFDGKISLYRVQYRGSKRVFFLKSLNGSMTELINYGQEIRFSEEGRKSYSYKDRRYRDRLYKELSGCDQLIGIIVNTPNLYREKQLQRLLTQWHKCTGNSSEEDQIAKAGLRVHLHGVQLFLNFGIVPLFSGFGATAEFRSDGFSLWGLQLGMEYLTGSGNFRESIYGFPISFKRIIPVNEGEFYGFIGYVSGISTERLSNVQDLRVRLIPVGLYGFGYEISTLSRLAVFFEIRSVHGPAGPSLPMLKMGIKL